MRKVVSVPPQDDSDTWDEPEIELDSAYYDRGTAARHRDHEALEDLSDVFDEIEARTDALLQDLVGVLESL